MPEIITGNEVVKGGYIEGTELIVEHVKEVCKNPPTEATLFMKDLVVNNLDKFNVLQLAIMHKVIAKYYQNTSRKNPNAWRTENTTDIARIVDKHVFSDYGDSTLNGEKVTSLRHIIKKRLEALEELKISIHPMYAKKYYYPTTADRESMRHLEEPAEGKPDTSLFDFVYDKIRKAFL